MRNLLMVMGCVLGVTGGAAPSTARIIGLPADWSLAIAASALLLVAFVMRWRSGKPSLEETTRTGKGSMTAARDAIARTAAEVHQLSVRAATIPIADLAAETNQLIERNLEPVIEAQTLLMKTQGFAKYAAHTGPWASGERMVYRAWSAATDGHRPEAVASLREAIPHFEEAARAF